MAYLHRASYRRHPQTWLLGSIVCLTAEIKFYMQKIAEMDSQKREIDQ